MKKLREVEKIDVVLKYANEHRDHEISENKLLGYLQLSHPAAFTNSEVASALKIMLKNRHINKISPGFYKITLNGIVFLESGGYTFQSKSNFIKRQYLRVARGSGNQTNSLFLWFLAIVGAIAAYLFIKYGYEHWDWKIPF